MDSVTGEAGNKAERAFEFFLGVSLSRSGDRAWILATHPKAEVRNGRDPQLEKAVAMVLEALEKNPPQQPKKPAYPNYHPKGK